MKYITFMLHHRGNAQTIARTQPHPGSTGLFQSTAHTGAIAPDRAHKRPNIAGKARQ